MNCYVLADKFLKLKHFLVDPKSACSVWLSMAPGVLKEPEKCCYPFSAVCESNLLEYFCRGNVFQTMTLLDAVKSRTIKTKSIAEPKSASADSATSTSKALLSFVEPEFENSTKIPKRKKSYEFDSCFGF